MWAVWGAIGVGVVWGWLLATLVPSERIAAALLAAGAATLLFIAEMLVFGGVLASLGFVAAAIGGGVLHLGLRDAIRTRSGAMEGDAR
jgi:hypothetical protein